MSKPTIVHLIDDTTAGGVTRTIDHLINNSAFGAFADHKLVEVRKGAFNLGKFDADVIISHITLNWRTLSAVISLRASHPSARLIHVEHSYTRAFTALNVAHRVRFYAMLRLSYALFDRVVAVSHAQANWMRERLLAPASSVSVISPRVDLSQFEKLSAPTGAPKTIGAIGRLERQKGFDILIEAFRKVTDPEAKLVIFGEGSEQSHLVKLADNDPRIEFKGHADSPEDAMAQIDVLAIPSRWEAYGLVCLEASAARRPILAPATDGLADTREGLITRIQANDPKHWTKALTKALQGDDAKFDSDGPSSRQADAAWVRQWIDLCATSSAGKASKSVSKGAFQPAS